MARVGDSPMPYAIHEIFASLQGEGRHTGRPVVFIRFAGCNLACPWCDTDHTPRMHLELDSLLSEVGTHPEKSVILTGGEPLLQPALGEAVDALKERGYWVGIETNGTLEPSEALRQKLDYIATSPKRSAPLAIRQADEVRLVVAPDVTSAWCESVRARVVARDYFLSPCDEGGQIQLLRAMTVLGKLNASAPEPPWRLSIQAHKFAKIP